MTTPRWRRLSAWPVMVLALASTLAAWSHASTAAPAAATFRVTDDAWESPTVPPPENGVVGDHGKAATRTHAGERVAWDPGDERLVTRAPAARPSDRSLRSYPSRASPA